jgi:hypothetical protein
MIQFIPSRDTPFGLDFLEEVSSFLQSALDHSRGEISVADIYKLVRMQRMQLWLVMDVINEVPMREILLGVIVTEVIDYPSTSSLRIVALGGERFSEWEVQADDLLVDFARRNNLDRIEIVGRKGWVRKLSKLGYEEAYTIVVKELR